MTQVKTVRIGTRGSQLALWQARTVAGLLHDTGIEAELVIIKTAGDRLQERPLTETGTKSLFVKEIEDALMRGEVDLAVHSAKDMPAVLPDGLSVAATLPREDPRDALVLPAGHPPGDARQVIAWLGASPTIGTSSVRRSAQLRSLIPGATFAPIRGNVDTRLRKLDDGGFNGLVLASAGMKRLGYVDRISAAIPIDGCVPAPGQGIVAIEIRSDDDGTRRALRTIHDEAAGMSLEAERTLVAALGGGCQLPLGGLAAHVDGGLDMHAVVVSMDGARVIRRRARGPRSNPAALGQQLAEALAAGGANEILEEVRRAQAD